MTTIVKRVPPPPPIATNDPVFNRWLHDLTALIASFNDLSSTVTDHTAQIAANTSNIAANTAAIATHTSEINANTAAIATNTSNIAANTAAITALNARSQVLHGTTAPAAGLGNNGDWYSDTTAHHIYVKTSGAWVLII